MSRLRYCIVLFILAAAIAAAQAPAPDCKLVPGWTQQGELRKFVADNLFEYMDGNAEGYLIYGFQKMQGVSCTNGGDTLVIDFSEMADADSAYGIFASNRDAQQPTLPIGMAGQIQERRAIFVKDKFFVEIAANPAKDHSAALKAFVTVFEKQIAGRTTLPDVLTWFPAEHQVKDSIRLIPESVLGLRILKRGYVAQYDYGKAFLVKEATADAAAAVLAKWKTRIGETKPAQLGDEAFQATDRYLGGLYVFRKGQFIGGFANLKPETDGAPLAKALAGQIP
jgi:hypothetical protein